jgi:hypothetical protein
VHAELFGGGEFGAGGAGGPGAADAGAGGAGAVRGSGEGVLEEGLGVLAMVVG